MTEYAVIPPVQPTLAVEGSNIRFPVHRIYCIGRNYAEHAKEMGAVPDKGSPVFFLKPGDTIAPLPSDVRYPPGTRELHHEIELVVAMQQGGRDIAPDAARNHVYGYAIGLDLTRRDLQSAAKAKGLPWDTGKSFEQAAPVGPIHRIADVGHPDRGAIMLRVNGALRQNGDLADMLFAVPEIIAELSRLYTLAPGDLIFTGTPAGVGPLSPGDVFEASIAGLGTVSGKMVAD